MYKGLSKSIKKKLEYEVISDLVRLNLARLFREITKYENDENEIEIILKNRIINIARQVEGLPLYQLETDDEYYLPTEHAWHHAELELITKRPDSITLIEILCDLIQENLVSKDDINEIFLDDNSKLKFIKTTNGTSVKIVEVDDIPDEDMSSEHPNIRKLVKRMEVLFDSGDWSGVLLCSASIFETLAKDIIKNPNIENKTLGSFFESYRIYSKLSEPVLDMIISIYNKRGIEPLAGHGQTSPTTISQEEAIILMEMTKSFVRMERKIAEVQIHIEK